MTPDIRLVLKQQVGHALAQQCFQTDPGPDAWRRRAQFVCHCQELGRKGAQMETESVSQSGSVQLCQLSSWKLVNSGYVSCILDLVDLKKK